jgi:branched-chain amino acid transport system ATP-binding protein
MTKSASLLQVRGLRVAYGPVTAVAGVDLDVAAGSLVALLGRNGAGKSSTLRAIAGLERPVAGHILFDGQPIGGIGAAAIVRLGVALVPEGRRIFADLTVQENLSLGAFVHAGRAEIVRRGFERTFALFPVLTERRTQQAGSLSGGQQQMLAVGRALMSAPRLLLLDEPSMGLSPLVTSELYAAIATLRLEGLTLLLVEQKTQVVLRQADRAYVLAAGRVVLSGPGEALAADPDLQSAYLGSTLA